MPRFDPVQSNFTAGEVSPKLLGNFEIEKYKQGLNKAENFIVEPTGGIRRRGGFKYIAAVKDSADITILQEFKYKDEFSYILEFGDLYIRFYRNKAQIVSGTAVEVVTTYTSAQVSDLRFTQDEDTLIITHKDHAPAKLTRTSHIAWTLEDIEFDEANRLISVCWSEALGIFVAVSYVTPNNYVKVSSNGEFWLTYPGVDGYVWSDVCWSPELGLFVAVAASGATGTGGVMTSPDGKTWTLRDSSSEAGWSNVCWGAGAAVFVAVAGSGGNRVMTSPDGITWTDRTAASTELWTCVCWSEDLTLFVAMANTAATFDMMYSADGVTWIGHVEAGINWSSICWSPELALFCAVSADAPAPGSSVETSPDGTTWTGRTGATNAVNWTSVIWASELSLFIATGYSSVIGIQIMTSPDGITWTSQSAAKTYNWRKLAYSPYLTKIVAVSSNLEVDNIMISYDGIAWITQYSTGAPANEWKATNYPTLCWFFEQRLFFASTPNEPNQVWGSRSANYFNFDTGTGLDNEGINVKLKEATKLLWVTTSNVILLGANNAEFKLAANNLNEALTPTNIRPVKVTSYGSAFLPAVDIDGNTLFVQRGLRKIRRIEFELTKDRWKAPDISILSEHIFSSGLTDLAYLNEPNAQVFGVRTDGQLVCLTYEPEYEVYGWTPFVVGGTDAVVKSIAVSDAVEADEDELWAIVSRTVNSATVQFVEFLTQGLTAEDDYVDATFMDSFVTKTGTAFTTFDGLDHLEGETVQVFADEIVQANKVVASGQITITAADKAHAGLRYDSTLTTLPIEGGNPVGSAMGKIKRISKMVCRLWRSRVFVLGDLLGNNRDTIDVGIDYTGDTEELDFYGTHETGGQILITVNNPVAFNLLAIMYQARTGE